MINTMRIATKIVPEKTFLTALRIKRFIISVERSYYLLLVSVFIEYFVINFLTDATFRSNLVKHHPVSYLGKHIYENKNL